MATGSEQDRSAADHPVVALVEWRAPGLTLADGERIAAGTLVQMKKQPGFVEGRFFGDFEGGTHYYLLTWANRAALDAYSQSEAMTSVRTLATDFVEGRPTRLICLDYTPTD